MAKIQLIRPPVDDWYTVEQTEGWVSVPTGLCIIAKHLKEDGNEVSIFDGLNLPIDEVLKNLNGDWVGVTDLYANHGNSLKILKAAKEKGAQTVIGGPNVNYLASRILKNNDFVDYAIIGDGEEALPELIRGNKFFQNLVYRGENNSIVRMHREDVKVLKTIFDLEDIINPFDNLEEHTVPISSIRGCIKAEESGRCDFCSIDHKLKVMGSKLVWKQLRLLYEKYGVKGFSEAGDSFIVGKYPERILKARPNDLEHLSFTRLYACPDQINQRNAKTLKQLGVKYVFLGIESIDDNLLKLSGKSYSKKDIDYAIKLLSKQGISFHLPFMYGLKGETPETMQKTFDFAKFISEKNQDIIIVTSLAVPLPGSGMFDRLITRHPDNYHGNIREDDIFDYQALVKMHLKHYTTVEYEHALEFVEKTRNLVKKGQGTSFDINYHEK